MIKSRSSLLRREGLENKMESDFMSTPNVPRSTPYHPVLQTQDYKSLRVYDEAIFNPSSVADLDFSWLDEPEQQLQEVYQEIEETCALDDEIESDEVMLNPSSVVDLDFSWLTEANQQLQEVYQEVEETCALDDEIDPVPDSAYYDAYSVLEILFYNNVPMPDIGWLADGGIGLEWRSQHVKGIGTMSIYGDNKVIYGASLGNGHKDKGTCELTDLVKFVRFLPTLKILCAQ